ncbi:MAG: NAD-glutamate dehydrogenase, partial [Acidobacteria bacterium]|nr:NAD-glutamate dehydrogenase [Acidobacteriota bacterium]
MAPTAEQRKADLIDKVVSEARARVAPNLAESVEQFIRRYFGVVSPDDIIYTAPETLLGGALSLWEMGAQRQKGVPKVRLFNPTPEKNGWGLEHTVIEIVNDDMPFLVDSVTAEINARERKIHLLLHPVARVRRDAEGNRVEITDTQHAPTDAVSESYMHIEVDQETDEAELEAMRASIEKILARVRMAVADFPKMRQRLQEDIAELESGKLPMPAEEVAEAREFLKWLDQGNFVFLGYRRYRFETRDGQDFLPPDADSGLGIRRTIHSESLARGNRALSKEDSEYARRKNLLIIIKADSQSVIHKRVSMDRIGIKRYDAEGNLIGEDRFLGLFTSRAYSRSPREIPTLRLKARRVEERAGLDPHSHNGKALAEILETFPRDEFFQITDTDLFDIAKGILLVQERQRVALFTRWDVFQRFVACYVYVPRDQYTPDFKERARAILEEGFEGRDTQVVDYVTESALARGLFIVRTPNGRRDVDTRRIEAELNNAASTWSDHLRDALIQNRGEEAGIELQKRYKRAFPAAYQERFTPNAALFDMQHIETALATGGVVVDLYRHRSDEKEFHFKIIHTGQPVALSEIMPRLENMGLRVESEVPYVVHPHGAQQVVRIRDFSLSGQGMQDDLEPVKQKFQETFLRVWRNEVQNDGFNRLVLAAELEWHEIVVLRAYAKYIRQIGLPVAEQLIQQTLAKHPNITRQLIDLFRNHFDPANGPAGKMTGREMAGANIRAQIEDALNSVTNTDEDSVLRTYVNLIDSTLRTNYYQRDQNGNRKAYISFKLDSQAVRNLPAPRPLFEIFVYSPQMEGIHLRGGKVARGGLRWSDRRLDFRTEILGLMKAQNVKNVVIVP